MTTSLATPTLSLTPASDTGVSHTDGVTDDTVPVFAGTASPGALVTLTDVTSGLSVTARADKYGNFVAMFAGLDPGAHALTASSMDAAGNVSPTSNPYDIDIETQATATITAAAVPDSATSAAFTVQFDQPVGSVVTPTSFVLATTGTAYGNVQAVSGSGQTYTVTVAGLGGEGTVGLALSGHTPTDVAGNQFAITSSVGHTVSDTTANTATLVSSSALGVQGTGLNPAISGGGRVVAFISSDGSLVPGVQTVAGVPNVYVKDLQTGAIAQVTNGDERVVNVQISADGSTVAFSSVTSNGLDDGKIHLNLYVAKLNSALSSSGLSLVPGSTQLVGQLNDDVDLSLDSIGFALSGDGSTLAYEGNSTAPNGEPGIPTDYLEKLATGTVTSFGTNAAINSISFNGGEVAETGLVDVPGTGGQIDPETGQPFPPDHVQDALVYSVATNATITIDGSGLLPGTNPPTGPDETPSYLTTYPVLSGDGNTLVFQLERGASYGEALFRVNLSNPSVFAPISPDASSGGSYNSDFDQSVSVGGSIIAYTDDEGTKGLQTAIYNATTGKSTLFGPGISPILAVQGNAYAVEEITDEASSAVTVYEVSLGVSASIAPIDGHDAVNAIDLKQAQTSGLAVSGTTNAPAGAPVQLDLQFADGTKSDTFAGTIGDDGQWAATIPADILNLPLIVDGPLLLEVQVLGAAGASPKLGRVFTIDTVAPVAPTAPVLDQGSNSGKDGVDTNVTTPSLDGQTEAGAFVTLFDVTGSGQTTLATATADQNGVYTLTSSALADGKYTLAVQAQDAAGNDSPLSATTTIKVDTVAPATPTAPLTGAGNITNDTTPTLIGRAEAGASVTLYDDGTALTTVKASAGGIYTVTAPALSDGTHDLFVTATDAAGNSSLPSDGTALTVDTKAPGAPLLASVSGQTLGDGDLASAFDVTGSAAAQTTITLEVDGVAVPADTAATKASGAYDIQVPYLDPGTHTLTVTATDAAGNVSQPSAPTTVTISSMAVARIGTPPGAITVNGILIDGPIAGATVFADANGNGVQDSGEAFGGTTTGGGFSLVDPSGELIASGGTDTETGLPLPGPLAAPAGSTVIDPLTTLLAAYAAATGQTPQAAQPALLSVLGLDPAADLTQINPETAVSGGDPSVLIADAKVLDSVVVLADLVAAQTGVSPAVAFAATVTALAQQAATGALDLQTYATDIVNAAAAAAAIADPGFVLPNGLAEDAAIIVDNGNYDLANVSGQTDPSAVLTMVDAIERVEQGQAAPQLAAASGNQAAADLVAQTYSSGLSGPVTNAETPILAAPVLVPSDDTGVSAHDDLTSDTTPTFTGKAPPGATVILAQAIFNTPGIYTIVGSGIADASGAYTVATTLPPGNDSSDNILAFEAAPGEATAVGTRFSGPTNLTDAEITAVTVGDLPADGENMPPAIEKVVYTAGGGSDATATSLYVTGSGAGNINEGAFYTVTANGIPVTEAAGQSEGTGNFGILTTPLAAGTYSLVVTETALDGETAQSSPTIVTVTAPGSLSIQAEAGGPVSGGSIVGYNSGYPYLVMAPGTDHPYETTDASGAASVPAQNMVPQQGSTALYPTDANGLALEGGQDTLTGFILPVNLSAPPGSSVITPATSLLLQADVDAASAGLGATGPYAVTATDYAYENSRIDAALGLPTTLNLTTADPLAMAEAGNPALFLKDIELLDTTFLLFPFTENGDAGFDTTDPLHVINKSLGIIKFANFLSGVAPPITTQPIDFTSAAEVLSWMTTFDNSGIGGSYDTQYDASVLPTAAAIIAAGNAAIEAFAATSTSLPDTIAYALAVERVTLSGEEQALAALAAGLGRSVAQQQAGFATLQADYTGPRLQAAVAAALAQTVEVTSFGAASASTGAAQDTFTITFSAPVGGVTAGDFTVAESAGLAGALVSAVTPVAGSNGAAYTVTVTTGVGNGTLTLDFTPNGLSNPDGSPLSTGTFAAPQSYSAPTGRGDDLANVATGDFNGDGHTDVVIANKDDADGITLFLGQGDGSYVAEPVIYTGSETGAIEVVTGDFNGDGKLDAVTLNNPYSPGYGGYENGDATVSAMLGDGDGGFAGPVETDVGPSAGYMVAGDFNGDGKLDLAVLNGNLQLFYGNGDGTFRAGPTTAVGAPLYSGDQLVAADLNGDGKLDLVIPTVSATTGAPGVAILLGNGQGGFTLAGQPTLGFTTITDNGAVTTVVAVADLNGDGIPDIVAVPKASTAGNNSAEILFGNGNGTFRQAISVPLPAISLPPALSYSNDGNNVAISIGDVTGDGKPDIVVENDLAGVVIAPGNGDGTFRPAYSDAAAGDDGNNTSTFGQMTLADVNGDGRLDLITTEEGGSQAGSSVTNGISVSLGTAQTVLPASATVAIDRPAIAVPALSEVSGGGTFTHVGNAYTLDLGTLAVGAATTATFSLANTAASPADSFDGTFSTPTGSGFTVTGASLAQPVAAGGAYGGLTFTANAGAPGAYSETITFAPRDATAIPVAATTPDPDGGNTASPAAAPVANPVAAELPAITLTVTADIVAGGVGTASLAPVPAITLPNVRVGDTDSESITISNTAAAPAANLDVTATAAGDATVSGSVSGLAPQASDTTSVVAGLGTASAGVQSGTITLAAVSEPSTALVEQTVAVSGSVYRPATAVITPIVAILHVGDAGLLSLGITNADPADGFSEDLDATLTSLSGPFAATAEGTQLVSAGASTSALTVGFSTAAASVLTGSVTVGLSSDGGAAGTGLDGLGTLALPSQTAPLSVTVDNYASASLQRLSGTGVLTASGTNYTLDLGTVAQGAAPLTELLGVVNAASGPADLLSGHFDLSDANAIGLTGFGDFAGLAAEQTDGGLDVSLDASRAGSFTRTVTLTPTGSNASGYSGALAPETLTITGTVAAAGSGSGTAPGGTTATGSQPGTSTPSLAVPVYRFFDTIHGTHLFTQSLSEAESIVSNRPDLMEETNNFGAVNPQTDPNAQAVYRFFEASNGTHFLTASYQEFLGLTTAGSPTYRPDLTYEANSTFYEHAAPQAGDVAVYRFFDTVQGTQYLTGSQSEYAGLTTAGSSTYRPDLTPEGTAFYAPAGSFST